jgi:hypothetical protein
MPTTEPELQPALPDPDKLTPDDPVKDVEEDLNPSIVPPADA